MLLMSVKSFAQVPSYVSKDSLKAWYPFNGNAKDESGNGNNGFDSLVTLTKDRFGDTSKAYDFTNKYSKISIPYSKSIGIDTINPITISFWFHSANNSFNSQRLFCIMDQTRNRDYEITYDGTKSAYQVDNYDSKGTLSLPSAKALSTKSWHHCVVIFYQSKNIVKGYIDCDYDTQSIFKFFKPVNPHLTIGNNPTVKNWAFIGQMDDLGIWDRALDSTEVLALYNSCVAINITSHPINQNVKNGKNAMFTVASSFSGATYQWQMDKGSGFTNITNGGQFSGATNDTLVISSLTSSNDGLKFRCMASSGSKCNDTSKVATLTVCPLIVTQPSNISAVSGKSAIIVSGSADINAKYQWQTDKGSGFVNLSTAGQYSGATDDTLKISSISSSNDGQKFRCIASSGSICKDTSKSVTLTVCPAITSQPSDQSVTETQSAMFIASSADVNASYQWQTDLGTGYANLSNAGQYSGVTNDTLTVSNTTLSNNNQNFRCIVKSGSSCIDTTTIAVLDVSVKNGINGNQRNHQGFAIYPNPANGQINVKIDASLIGSFYTVIDAGGRTIMNGKLSSVNSIISIESLANGEYIFKLGNRSSHTFKVIKN